MRTIVTGGAGFIGSHVVDKLVDAGHEVLVVDHHAPHRPDVGFAKVDILDIDALTAAFEGNDVVFHLAAVSDVNIAADNPDHAVELTVLGTSRVWEAARRAQLRRSVLASTVWVFGASPQEPPLTEQSLFAPSEVNHVYTATKLACEMIVHSYHQLYGQEFTILRYGVPYGPRMRDVLVIPRFVSQAVAGTPITLFGDGSQYRNFVYVEDLAAAHVLALEPAAANEVFNLEGSERVAMRDIIDALSFALGHRVAVQYLPERPGDYGGRQVSNAHAAEVLGWHPHTAFRDGLRAYVDWYLARVESHPTYMQARH